jgi:hypothetical protein
MQRFFESLKLNRHFRPLLVIAAACFANVAIAENPPRNNGENRNNWALNQSAIQNITNNAANTLPELGAPPSNWPLGIEHKTDWMRPDTKTLRARIEASLTQPEYADPVTLRVLKKDPLALLKQLATNDFLQNVDEKDSVEQHTSQILTSLKKRIQNDKLVIKPEDMEWLDLEKLASVLQSQTAVPELSVFEWIQAINRDSSRKALANYFQTDFERIQKVMNAYAKSNGVMGEIPFKDLLPPRAKSLYGKYSHLRGRNCFGTALEFATPRTILNKIVNTETEEGHYRAMINSDEFARALWLGYNELSASEILMGLNWGDVVVFYDASVPYSWQSLRHAVVHMGGDIYFHKQSKSAASPIELVTWNSLVTLWQRIAPTLDYRVYRKHPQNSGQSTFQKPTRAIEKLTWTR